MSDILLQNAISQVTEAITDKIKSPPSLPSLDMIDLKATIISGVDDILASLATNTSGFKEDTHGCRICLLSCQCQIGSCYHAVRGAAQSPLGNQDDTNSSWSQLGFTTADSEDSLKSIIDIWFESPSAILYKLMYNEFSSVQRSELKAVVRNVLIEHLAENDINPSGLKATLEESLISTDILKVCGASWKTGEGKSQQWVVPAGASRAKFQGTSGACCCGGNQFGANGAFAQVIMDVTPGETYTLCAGCSCSRYCCSNSEPGRACMSGVTGPGISTLKADGGCWNNCNAMHCLRTIVGVGGTCYRFQNPYCTSSGPCYCNYGEYCFGGSCSTCGVVPIYADCSTGRCFLATIDSSRNPEDIGGMRPLHGGGCLDTNNYGWHSRPPVLDSDECKMFTAGCQIQTFTSGSCCGGCHGKDWATHPGHGGAGTHVMGGANNHIGDTGRGGLVKVEWK